MEGMGAIVAFVVGALIGKNWDKVQTLWKNKKK